MNGKATAINHGRFDGAFNECHAKFYSDDIKNFQEKMSTSSIPMNLKKQLQSRALCYQTLQSICWPLGKRLVVTGITGNLDDGNTSVAHSAQATQSALKEYWGRVYSA